MSHMWSRGKASTDCETRLPEATIAECSTEKETGARGPATACRKSIRQHAIRLMTTVQVLVPWRDDGCSWRRAAWDFVKARWLTQFPDWRIMSASDGAESGPFNVARALNACVDASTADVCVVTGADAVLRPECVVEAVKLAEAGRWVMAADVMWRLDRLDTEAVLAMEPDARLPNLGRRRVCQSGWGPLVAPRRLLLERLWDERMVAGGEDDVFGLAAETLWGPAARVTRSPVHLLYHPSPQRAKHPQRDEAVALLHAYKCCRWDQVAMHRLSREWQ